MVKAVDFAVRTSAGTVLRGAVAGEGGSEFLQVGSGEAVSLNLSQSSVTGYERQGKDLVLKLSDGRQIVLSGYFEANPGEDNKLYLSSNGEIAEVYLTDGGNGVMYANYGPADTWNKYSALDDLRFVDDPVLTAVDVYADDTVGMGAFVPGLLGLGGGGAGLGAAAAVAGGVGALGVLGGGSGGIPGGGVPGGGGATPTRAAPTVDQPNASSDLSTNTLNPVIVVSGTGEPGDAVQVVVGNQTQTTVVTPDGKWVVTIPETSLPPDGTHDAVVTVTPPGGAAIVLDGPTFVVDMTPPAVSVTQGTQSTGDIENAVEYADGVTLSGAGEPGAAIAVQIGGATQATTVNASGSWTVTFTQTQVAGGEYSVPVTVAATDPMGNTTVITETLVMDTIPHPLNIAAVAGDNVINSTEASGAVTVTGTSTAGAVVTVTLDGVSQQVTTGGTGTWTATYPAGTFTTGDGNRTLTATTVDGAGNSSTTTRIVVVDTTTSVTFSAVPVAGDNIVNNTEAGQPISFTGQAEAGSQSVSVAWNGVTLPATVAPNGSWTVTFPAGTAPQVQGTGSVTTAATVTAVDAAGNTGTDVRSFTVDRATGVAVNAAQAGGDNVISGAEANAGISFTGTAEAGSQVVVTFEGATRTVTAANTGAWSASFTSAEVPRGTYASMLSVRATDLAGNTATATHPVTIDTEVRDFALSTLSTGADNVLNKAEAANGLTVTGTVEAGATGVSVMFNGAGLFPATVSGTTWSLTVPASAIPGGETVATLTATATDRYGNVSAPITSQVAIDQVVTPFARSGATLGGDGTLNGAEVAAGLDLNGTAEAGARVVVSLSNGAFRDVTVGADGLWTTRFEPADLPRGEGGPQLEVTVSATDLAGNTNSFSELVTIDTVAPGAPEVLGFSKFGNVVDGLYTQTINAASDFVRINADGSGTAIGATDAPYRGNAAVTQFDFDQTVPDGSYLVINTADAAGNSSSTLLIVDNTAAATVDLGRSGLAAFDLSAVDLSWAPQANLTISAAQLEAMTGVDNTLLIKGDADDHVTLQDVTATHATQTVGGQVYNVYTLGTAGATILVDDTIPTVI